LYACKKERSWELWKDVKRGKNKEKSMSMEEKEKNNNRKVKKEKNICERMKEKE
jgi:hypothetical protein